MKAFNLEKFCQDLIKVRSDKTQSKFAGEMSINRSTLSLLESGKQIPSLEILNKFCDIANAQPGDYFFDMENDGLLYLMGTLEEEDKNRIEEMMERIRIKEKYAILSRRCNE